MSKSDEKKYPLTVEDAADKVVRQAFLFDFYGELLNEHQRGIYEAFVSDNLSLSEIAEDKGVSRQSVHDLIKRCDSQLEQYESKLHLFEKFQIMKHEITRIQEIALVSENLEGFSEIGKICNRLLLEL